jgi:hypothetical protein
LSFLECSLGKGRSLFHFQQLPVHNIASNAARRSAKVLSTCRGAHSASACVY